MVVTEWDVFRALDLDRVAAAMRAPVLIDLRHIYRLDEMRRRGFTYVSVGRGSFMVHPAHGAEGPLHDGKKVVSLD